MKPITRAHDIKNTSFPQHPLCHKKMESFYDSFIHSFTQQFFLESVIYMTHCSDF